MIREKYRSLIQDFLDQVITVEDFESSYLREFKKDSFLDEPELFHVLDRLFAAVDCYWAGCLDGQESEFEISEAQLRRDASIALKFLRW